MNTNCATFDRRRDARIARADLLQRMDDGLVFMHKAAPPGGRNSHGFYTLVWKVFWVRPTDRFCFYLQADGTLRDSTGKQP